MEYWPHIVVDGTKYELTTASFCVDFGGRQIECEFIYYEDGTWKDLFNTYYFLDNSWDKGWPSDNTLTEVLDNIYREFNK